MAPTLSVVIGAHNPGPVIGECLAALQAQGAPGAAEVIVADSSSDGTADLVLERFPGVRLLRFHASLTVPQLRGMGLAQARGEIVAILDPFCIVQENWLAEVIRLHAERPEAAIGGAVALDGGGQGVVGVATYLCEYAAFIPPLLPRPAAELTGNNISYKRPALADAETLQRSGFWKTFVNWELQRRGAGLWTAPTLIVKLRKSIPFTKFLRSRYHYGRCFAAMRVAEAPVWVRWLRAATTPLLPPLALWRQARTVWPRCHYRGRFVKALPILLLFHLNWAWGECWGYLRGPGQSCRQMFF